LDLSKKTGTTAAEPSKDSDKDNPFGSIGDFNSLPNSERKKNQGNNNGTLIYLN